MVNLEVERVDMSLRVDGKRDIRDGGLRAKDMENGREKKKEEGERETKLDTALI